MTKIIDGEFALVNIEDLDAHKTLGLRSLNSVVVHTCKKVITSGTRDMVWYPRNPLFSDRTTRLFPNLHTPCMWCDNVPSEKLVTLWTLQNFDHLVAQGKGLK